LKKLSILLLFTFPYRPASAQTDTMIWTESKPGPVDQKYADGYHVFFKKGVRIKEFRLKDGKIDGILKNYYDNGHPKEIAELKCYYNHNISYHSGIYKEFYESGKLKLDGNYEIADSVTCVSCFDLTENKKISKAQSHSNRVGVWKEYYENGKLRASGSYNGIHETNFMKIPKPTGEMGPGVFIPGDYSEEYMKDKNWNYYNEKGELIREEFYFQGVLCDVREHDR
jgi:antitoxin component YwqK of YwqJK toxin-antitoxin module